MAPKILTENHSLDALYDEVFFTLAATAADPEAAKFSPSFEQLLTKQWQPAVDKERALRQAILSAQAHCMGVARRMDGWIDRFHNALLIVTNNRRDVGDYTRYFAKPPSAHKRPALSIQLQTITEWVSSIKSSSVTQLAALGTELETLVTEGTKAAQVLREAKAQMKDFRTIGARKALFDQANSLRQATFGALATLVYEQPKKCLPSDWPSTFFRHGSAERRKPETQKLLLIDELATLRAAVADSEKRLAALEAAEQRMLELAAQRRAAVAKLAELEQQARATDQAAHSLRAELSHKPSRASR